MFLNLVFIFSALLTLVSTVFVAMSQNIMHACIYLLGTLIGVAGLYVTLGADFIAAAQIMVYVGGVVIIMLFAVMLTGGKEFMDSVQSIFSKIPYMGNTKTYSWAVGCAIVLLLSLAKIVMNIKHNVALAPDITTYESTIDKIGISLLTDHVLAFELSSVLLLGALIGAAVIARPKKD